MILIRLPEEKSRPLVFFLAMEEYLAHLPDVHEAFFLWRVDPTVIIGRNQVLESEVNVPYCKAFGVDIFRRKSGGGCVYADRGNVMVSYVSDIQDVVSDFEAFVGKTAEALRSIGLDAEMSGRNDILVEGVKVSGNAFFKIPGRGIVHGTLLYDVDFDVLEAAITPSADKMASKGVKSARARVANIKDLMARAGRKPFEDSLSFMNYLEDYIRAGDEILTLSPEQVLEIETIEQSYLKPRFIYGNTRTLPASVERQVSGSGNFCIHLESEFGLITDINLTGDYFPLKEGFENILSSRLGGCPLQRHDVQRALSGIDVGEYILNMDNEKLLNIIFG